MQEESGEAVCNDSNGLAEWLCPLCQLGQEDRGSLSLHLTDKHNVLPTCVDKLLNIAAPTQLASGENRPTATRITDAEFLQLKQVQASDAPSNLPQHDVNADPTQKSQANVMEEKPECIGGQENVSLHSQSVDSLPPDQSKTENNKSQDKNNVPKTESQPFRCNACLDTFPTKTALSVHYNSLSHVQRMKTGSSNPDGEINSGPSVPVLSRPYISNKPYQCAVCRVSYNHAITLESHMKSVLHQTRSRNAGNAGNIAAGNTGSNSTVVTPGGRATHLSTTTNCVGQGNLMVSKDSELIQTTLAPSLLSSPVASAQAVSAFLTLLTSSPSSLSHSLLPSIFAPGATPGAPTTQLMTQPQMLMPLILNGLQAQSQGLPPENIGHLLTQAVPLQGLNAAQQAILAQKICRLQNQWPTVGISQTPPEVGKQYIKCKEEGGKEECAPVEENRLLKVEGEDSLDMEMCDFKKERAEEKGHTEHLPYLKAESKRNRVEREESILQADIEHTARDSSANPLDGEQVKDKIAQLQISLSPIADKCLPDDNGSPCGSIPSTSSLSPVNWNLTLSPDSTPKKSQSGTSSSASVETPRKCSSFKKPSISPDKSRSVSNIRGRQLLLGPSVLSEFQSEVLWAFFESRSEADAASPPHEDCEALGREVGLTEKEVRKWLSEARNMKERQRATEREYRKGLAGFSSGGFENDNNDECSLVIAEGDDGFVAIDLSSSKKRRRRERDMGRDSQADYCLTSDSDNEEVYTSVIVSDEDSQHGSMKEGPDSPTREDLQREPACGGKVLRSTTVFLSEAEDEDDEEGSEGQRLKRKRRKGEFARDEIKLERQDPDVDLELEAQADPAPLPHTLDHTGLHSGVLHSLPLSLSLAPLSQFIRPYVLSLPHSVVGVGVAEGDGGKTPAFPSPPNVTRFSDPLITHSLSPRNETSCYLSNSGGCESALDLSIGKSNSSKASSSTYAMGDKTAVQKGRLLDGLGLRPTAKGLIVVQVKPEQTAPISNSFTNCNNMTKTSAIYMRASEKMNATLLEKEQEMEKEREQKRPKGKRYRDMRRSRTIIQAEQLDILYGCYFKDPNPGKHEFEQISEWVHLPKKVVQIWFQNMRARERKGEVRFISDGTLAAVGKPLIKFTWPLSKPIFSSVPKSGTNSGSVSAIPVRALLKSVKTKGEDKEVVKGTSQVVNKPKEATATFSSGNSSTIAVPKTKLKTTSNITMVKIAPKTAASILPTTPKEPLSTGRPTLKRKLEEVGEDDQTDEEDEEKGSTPGPGVANRMVPKLPSTAISKPPVSTMISQKQNGINCWSAKSPFKINTLSREQLGLSAPMPHTITTSATPASTPTATPNSTTATSAQPNTHGSVKVATTMTKSSPTEGSFLHHSSSRRPRTHLSCLQLSILQSCYETCAHPNAMECEAIGTELGLPLKVVQIWFQNTRAKEKRWRLQQEKLSPLSSEKVDVSSGSYLQYNALRANRPILPKPVQLTVLEPAIPPIAGQQATKETLRGRCDVCDATFESRAAARSHVFSGRHLATLRSTNFGQPATLVNNKGSGSGSSSVTGPSGEGVESSPTSTSNAS